ncbi:PHA/PHB synthase family protein [Halopseudomonas pelagia]|uniref:PHA/PHB synthase family protein n=1 Tax=Halopseudomonas pelagia TaxID=553151 RepID=UPI0003AAC59C|nr:poly(R)-hydroxyalkanoic acid synthase [Halopseudomonas pelagia]|tara:strand:+ start:25066 stop:26697 length:1632 start_codon:yes stop_codon:yes gene_type:complete
MPATRDPDTHAATSGDLIDSLRALLGTLPAQPCHHARHALDLSTRLLEALSGTSDEPLPANHAVFHDPGWQDPIQRRALQAWLSCQNTTGVWFEQLALSEADRSRLTWLGMQVAAALAPSNSPLNPVFLRQLKRSSGRSLAGGLKRLACDLAIGRPLAPLTEEDSYLVGRDLATTAGQVVLRDPMFELIQYQPRRPEVHQRPLLIIPPPLNRFYLLDLNPQQSLIRHALDQGLQVFLISWRNPQAEHCEWGFSRYVGACDRALTASSRISNSQQASLLGVCAGGILGLLLQGLLQARGDGARLCSASYLVTPINPHLDTPLLHLSGPATQQRLRARLWQQGYLSARQLAASFAWLRPEQFVWPQALARYALDQPLARRDILYWSQDSTRLPARLVEDLLDLFQRDPLSRPGHLCLLGHSIDLKACTQPSWHLGARRDHIVPWANCFPGGRLGGDAFFVQSHSGHIQSLINPPEHPGAVLRSGPAIADATGWLANSVEHRGSWWPHWSGWLRRHSGALQPATGSLGSLDCPTLGPAPGRYVHDC